MKLFKKIVLMVIVFLLCLTMKAYAGVTEVNLKTSSTEVKPGEKVTVTVSAVRGNGIEGFDAVLEYDKTKLKLTNEGSLAGENYSSLSGTDDLTGEFRVSLMYIGSGDGPAEADIAKLEFEVLDGAKVDDILSVKLTDIQLIDSELTGTEVEDKEVQIKVIKEETPGGNTNTNTPSGNTNTNTPGGNTNTPGQNNNASGDYPYAGTGNIAFIIISVVTIIAIAMYIKIKKYRDIN